MLQISVFSGRDASECNQRWIHIAVRSILVHTTHYTMGPSPYTTAPPSHPSAWTRYLLNITHHHHSGGGRGWSQRPHGKANGLIATTTASSIHIQTVPEHSFHRIQCNRFTLSIKPKLDIQKFHAEM